MITPKEFKRGAVVLIDGRLLATVFDAFPEGSTSYAFPHYCVIFKGGRERTKVRWDRVGVVAPAAKAGT
jgi:hypothetical protein